MASTEMNESEAEGSELSIAWLEEMALANMSNDEFRDALDALDMTIESAASYLGLSRRSVSRYRTDTRVPRSIAFALRFLLGRRSRYLSRSSKP